MKQSSSDSMNDSINDSMNDSMAVTNNSTNNSTINSELERSESFTHNQSRSIWNLSRWVVPLAMFTVVLTELLLILGSLVTTFRVGMADPVWPTTPWYLFFIDWKEPSSGFLIEHVHRLAGFTVGGIASLLAIFLLGTDKNRFAKWMGMVLIIAMLGVYGAFHGQMMKQVRAEQIVWPMTTIYLLLGSIGALLIFELARIFQKQSGAWLRLLMIFALLGVMIQGLLGGLRVRLDALFGTNLAAVHGVFAQMVFSLLVVIAVWSRRPNLEPLQAEKASRGSSNLFLATLLFASALMQLIWGAWLRHLPGPIPQRLHFLSAFLVFALAIWNFFSAKQNSMAGKTKMSIHLLLGFLVLQISLGVEAWLGKFLSPIAPELQTITASQATIRCLHVIVGTGITATSAVIFFAAWRFHLARKRFRIEQIGKDSFHNTNTLKADSLEQKVQLSTVNS